MKLHSAPIVQHVFFIESSIARTMTSHVGVLVKSSVSAWAPTSTGSGRPWSSLLLTLLIAAFYVPETPSCLSLRGRKNKAAESLQWLRGQETDVRQEWNTIQANVRRQRGPSPRAPQPRRPSGSKSASCGQYCGVILFHRISVAHAFNF